MVDLGVERNSNNRKLIETSSKREEINMVLNHSDLSIYFNYKQLLYILILMYK
jgi:hypothetical protein